MWVEVIKPYVEYLGVRGAQRDIPREEARIHVLLGNVKEVMRHAEEPPELDESERPVIRKKRTYKRRDLRAQE